VTADAPPFAAGEFRYGRRVQFAETDLAGIVHFSTYFRYMEEAEHALFRAAGLSVAHDGLHWPRVAASCDFRQPLRFEDEIEVVVRAAFGRRRMTYAFTIVCRGATVSTGSMSSVCARVDAQGRLTTLEVPADVRGKLQRALQAGNP
jgi:acyl-CoA thioester hydrolase